MFKKLIFFFLNNNLIIIMSQGLTSDRLSQLQSYIEYNLSRSQLEYYTQNNASPEIMRYVSLEKHLEKNVWNQ